MVMILIPITNMLAPPLWGVIADAFSARVALIRSTGIGCAIGALVLMPDFGFVGALGGMAIYCFFRAPIIPLADAATYASLGARSDHYSQIRVWGSIGFAITATTVGQFDGSRAPLALFGITAAVYLASSATTFGIRAPFERQPNVLRRTLETVRKTTLPLFFVGSAFYYVGHGAFDVYFGLHMKALGHSDAFVGIAWSVGVGCEIALMFFAPRLLTGRTGVWFLVIGACASILRWWLLSVVSSQWAILGAMTLHALTFGLWYVALVKYVQAKAPETLRTSVQGLAQAFMAVGMIGGYLGGAELYERFGGVAVFRFAAAAAGVALIFYVLLTRARERTID